jgi:hypothetical protein
MFMNSDPNLVLNELVIQKMLELSVKKTFSVLSIFKQTDYCIS